MEREKQAEKLAEELNRDLRKHQKVAMNCVLIKTALCLIQAVLIVFSATEDYNPVSLSFSTTVLIFLIYSTIKDYLHYRAWKKTPFLKRSFRS